MKLNLFKLLGFYQRDPAKPYRVYFNASRYPNVEIATHYNAVVNVYIRESLDRGYIENNCEDGLPAKESFLTFEFPKLSFLNNNSEACAFMNKEAEKMLLKFEREMHSRRLDELKDLYGFFHGFKPDIKTFPEVNELIDFIRGRLKSWAEFEIAKMLPIWLYWFGNLTSSRIHKWYSSVYFEAYLDGIYIEEKPVVTQIFENYFTSQPTGVDYTLYAQFN